MIASHGIVAKRRKEKNKQRQLLLQQQNRDFKRQRVQQEEIDEQRQQQVRLDQRARKEKEEKEKARANATRRRLLAQQSDRQRPPVRRTSRLSRQRSIGSSKDVSGLSADTAIEIVSSGSDSEHEPMEGDSSDEAENSESAGSVGKSDGGGDSEVLVSSDEEEKDEKPASELSMRLSFVHFGKWRKNADSSCELRMVLKPDQDHFRVEAITQPAEDGAASVESFAVDTNPEAVPRWLMNQSRKPYFFAIRLAFPPQHPKKPALYSSDEDEDVVAVDEEELAAKKRRAHLQRLNADNFGGSRLQKSDQYVFFGFAHNRDFQALKVELMKPERLQVRILFCVELSVYYKGETPLFTVEV